MEPRCGKLFTTDIEKRKWNFVREIVRQETIFDVHIYWAIDRTFKLKGDGRLTFIRIGFKRIAILEQRNVVPCELKATETVYNLRASRLVLLASGYKRFHVDIELHAALNAWIR